MDREQLERQQRENTERAGSVKAQVLIYDKVTKKPLDHFECAHDEAKRRARNAIAGKKNVGFKITTMQN